MSTAGFGYVEVVRDRNKNSSSKEVRTVAQLECFQESVKGKEVEKV